MPDIRVKCLVPKRLVAVAQGKSGTILSYPNSFAPIIMMFSILRTNPLLSPTHSFTRGFRTVLPIEAASRAVVFSQLGSVKGYKKGKSELATLKTAAEKFGTVLSATRGSFHLFFSLIQRPNLTVFSKIGSYAVPRKYARGW